MEKIIVLFISHFCLIIALTLNIKAQSVVPDSTFSFDGKVTTNFGNIDDRGYSAKIQNDGKILVAGWTNNGSNYDFALARYNINGSLDSTFNFDGKTTLDFGGYDDRGYSLAIQKDNKIVVAGYACLPICCFAIVRYNIDGSLDSSFNYDGKVLTSFGSSNSYGYSLAIQNDNKIVVLGYYDNGPDADFALARYNFDGSLDNSFDYDGKLTTDFGSWGDMGYSIAIQSDGKILAVGRTNGNIALARYNSNGSLDSTFSSYGKVITPYGCACPYSMVIQSDGKIVVVGSINNDIGVTRYNSNGSIDSTFDLDGQVTTDFGGSLANGSSIAIESDGKIVVVGQSYNNGSNYSDFAVVRYNSDGSLDSTFDFDGKVTTDFSTYNDWGYSIAIQSDGKILVAGESSPDNTHYEFGIVRYDNNFLTGYSSQPIIQNKFQIIIQPNPIINTATLIIHADCLNETKNLGLTFFNILGMKQEVSTRLYMIRNTEYRFEISRGNLKTGLYFFQIKDDNQFISSGKLIIE